LFSFFIHLTLPPDHVCWHLSLRAKSVEGIITRKETRAHNHVFLSRSGLKVELLQDCSLFGQICDVCCAVLGADHEQLKVARDVNGANRGLGMLNFKFLLVALEVFRQLEDPHDMVIASRGHERVVVANHGVVQTRIFLGEVCLKFLKRIQLACFFVDRVEVHTVVD